MSDSLDPLHLDVDVDLALWRGGIVPREQPAIKASQCDVSASRLFSLWAAKSSGLFLDQKPQKSSSSKQDDCISRSHRRHNSTEGSDSKEIERERKTWAGRWKRNCSTCSGSRLAHSTARELVVWLNRLLDRERGKTIELSVYSGTIFLLFQLTTSNGHFVELQTKALHCRLNLDWDRDRAELKRRESPVCVWTRTKVLDW